MRDENGQNLSQTLSYVTNPNEIYEAQRWQLYGARVLQTNLEHVSHIVYLYVYRALYSSVWEWEFESRKSHNICHTK